MANQMIALQARNPQLPDPARATAQMANMMNMATQQRAAQLQGERIRQEMDFARAGEDRAIQTQQASMREKDLSFMVNDMKRLRNIGVAVLGSRSEEGYQSWVDMVEATDPQLGATIRQVAPTFNPDIMNYLITEADKYIDKNIPQRTSKSEFDANGNLIIIDQGGFDPAKIRAGVITDQPDTARAQSVPPATPTAAAGADVNMRATRGANTTPQDLMDQGMDPRNIPSGMPTSPASFTRGGMGGSAEQMTPEVAQQIVDAAVKTGMMAQADFDQLMALAPEQNKQPFMDMIRANNITLQPDGMGQRPQSQFADLRGPAPQSQTAGLRGAPPMEQTLAQYQVGQQVKGRNPNLSPYPGSAQVPLSRVAGEAEARRETPEQIKIRKAAELQAAEDFEEANKGTRLAREREKVFEGERAKKDAAFVDSYSDATTKGRTTLNVIDQMIGDARIEKGKLVVPKGGRRPHPGFEGVVGMGVPGVRFIPGTQAASFDALFRQAEGGAFLQAYESLRGTGQITEIEGTKATSALTRMERSQSEAEFVKAAREFADVIRGAVDRADKRYTTLTGKAPPVAAPRRKTPTKGSDGWGKAKVVGN